MSNAAVTNIMSSRQYQWQQKRRASNLCVKCGTPTDGGPHCAFHKAWATEYKRAKRERMANTAETNTP